MEEDFTLIVCSYETPKVLELMLKSYCFHNSNYLPQKILIMENSRDEATVNLLKENNILFKRNPGFTHSISLDLALQICDNRYALVVDSDVLFNKNIKESFDYFVENNGVLMGEMVKSRGGYNLVSRIGPWFMFVNVESIHKHNIRFHDQQRINETGSQGFFNNVPLQRNEGKTYMDVGSSFLQDTVRAKLKVMSISEETRKEYINHYEGCSWRQKSGIPQYVQWGQQVESRFLQDAKQFEHVDLKDKFYE